MNNEDGIWPDLLKIMLLRGLEGESQIQETIKWDSETKAMTPATQALVMALGLGLVYVGLFAIGSQLGWLFGARLGAGDYLLVASLASLVVLALVAAVRIVAANYAAHTARWLALALCLLLVVAISAAVWSHRGQFTVWRGGALGFGFILLLPGLALSYRMLTDLIDPFGKTSPVERAVFPHLDRLFDGGQDPPAPPPPRTLQVEVRENGNRTRIVDAALLDIDDDHLLRFARLVSTWGLAENKWSGDAAFPEGINQYRTFRARLIERGLVRYRDPQRSNLGFVLTPAGEAFCRRLREFAEAGV